MSDNRYKLFPYLRAENKVEFIGGPLHGEFMEVQQLMPEYRVAIPPKPEARFFQTDSDPTKVEIKVGRYKLIRDNALVLMRGWQWLYAYVFMGEE